MSVIEGGTEMIRWKLERKSYSIAFFEESEVARCKARKGQAANPIPIGVSIHAVEIMEAEIERREWNEKYPEHAKLEAIPREERDAIGDFLEWSQSEGYTLCQWLPYWNNGEPRYVDPDTGFATTYEDYVERRENEGFKRHKPSLLMGENPDYDYREEGFYQVHQSIEGLLARYYDIDRQALSEEKDRMYRELVKEAR